jgi:hypothetical protein
VFPLDASKTVPGAGV